MEVNDWLSMNSDQLKTGPVSLEKLCKQPKEDCSHLFILKAVIEHAVKTSSYPKFLHTCIELNEKCLQIHQCSSAAHEAEILGQV